MTENEVHLINYDFRDEWLAARRGGIGASESAALFGLSPWDSELSLWTKKRGLADDGDEEREWMEIGSLMEPVVAALYAKRTRRELWAPPTSWAIARHRELPFMTASVDRWVIDADGKPGRGVLEMKNVGFGMSHEWEDGPPLRVQIQLQHQLDVTGFQWGSVAGILGGNKFVSFDFTRNEEFIGELREACTRFWRLVDTGKMPQVDGSASTARALKRLYPKDDGTAVHLDDESEALWNELAALRKGKSNMEKKETELKNLLSASIGAATFGLLPDGRLLSYRHQERDGYMVAPTQYRVLREEKKAPTSPVAFVDRVNEHAKGESRS